MTKVKAIFKGQNGSCGYEHDKEYTLLINHADRGRGLIDITSTSDKGGFCSYQSMPAFLKNWDNVRSI